MDTTMSVSVLYVPSEGRWSEPINRMFNRSLPFHAGMGTSGRALPMAVDPGAGEEVIPGEDPLPVSPEAPGAGVASSAQAGLVSLMKMQPLWRTSSASRS